jgi:endoglucanase
MIELMKFLKELISVSGLSGYEAPVRSLIVESWRPFVDEVQVSRLGSLHALKKGGLSQQLPDPPSLLVAAHMDSIGLMVTGITKGFLRITQVGGLDARILPGQIVTVHGRRELPGVIVQPPGHLLPDSYASKPVPLEYLLVDTGLAAEEVEKSVRPGDLVSFAQAPIEFGEDILAGHSLDNRASVAALTHCLQELSGRKLSWDLWAVATAQEEETLGGALTSAYQIRPKLAVAIDVTFGSSPGSPEHKTYPIGEGITLGWGPNIHPGLHKSFQKLADQLEIPTRLEPLPRHSGTDAFALQIAAEGVPTMVISIPLRYMHTPVEMVSMKDIRRAGRLLAEFAAQLDDESLNEISWQNS